MMIQQKLTVLLCLIGLGITPYTVNATPWADNVVSYDAGVVVTDSATTPPTRGPLTTAFTNPVVALGEPARLTSSDDALTIALGADSSDDVVSIGEGGQLTISFDEPVTDDPNNPFGIDLLIFGNAFLYDYVYNPTTMTGEIDGLIDGVFGEDGIVEVSTNGDNYVIVPGVFADGLFPTRGFLDDAATIPTDFTSPVDPAFDPVGHTLAEINASYGNSGGGLGIDLADVNLASITHVRISNPAVTDLNQGYSITPEIDAIVDVAAVPEPTTLALVGGFLALLLSRRQH